MYFAWLCYPYGSDASEDPKIVFEEPNNWEYSLILPIQFNVLHQWTFKDKALYSSER